MILSFIRDNLGSIVAGAAVLLIVILAVAGTLNKHKKGGCGCGCSGCSGSCPHCTPSEKKETEK